MLQTVGREHGTINYSARKLRDIRDARRSKESQGPRPHIGGYTATQVGRKVTIEVTIHDGCSN